MPHLDLYLYYIRSTESLVEYQICSMAPPLQTTVTVPALTCTSVWVLDGSIGQDGSWVIFNFAHETAAP